MWLICVLACITSELVVANTVPQKVLEGPFEITEWDIDDRALDYIDKGHDNRDLRWPLGIVPYYLDHSNYDYLVAERVRLAMNSIEETSCVRFKAILEPWSESHWIHITNKARVRDCTHETAANGTGLEIIMTMGIDCLQRRDILHLLMHALGFKDEITHPKRDQYVRVLWDNINPAYHALFRIRHEDFPTTTTEYDPMSIMHFHDRAFSKNGQATIAPLIPGLVINPSFELSPLDKMKLRLMFGHECNRREVGDLLDSCKTAMHEGDDDNVQNEKPDTDDNTKVDESINETRDENKGDNDVDEESESDNNKKQYKEDQHGDEVDENEANSAARTAKP